MKLTKEQLNEIVNQELEQLLEKKKKKKKKSSGKKDACSFFLNLSKMPSSSSSLMICLSCAFVIFIVSFLWAFRNEMTVSLAEIVDRGCLRPACVQILFCRRRRGLQDTQ